MVPIAWMLAALVATSQTDDSKWRQPFEDAVAHQKDRKWDEAVRRYRTILSERPDLVLARIYLGEALLFSGRTEEALSELDAAHQAVPDSLLPLLLLARVNEGMSEDLSARFPNRGLRSRLRQYSFVEGEAFVPIERPILVLASIGDIDGAIEDYRVASGLDPFSSDLHRNVGNVLFKASRTVEAVSAFERVVVLDPKDAGAWGQLGSSYLRLMWWDSAIVALEKARALSGEQPAGLLALGYAYERRPDFEKALELYRRASDVAPTWAQARYRAGRALIKLDRLDDAEKALERALELDPKMAEAACFLGAVLLDKGEVVSATRELERAVVLGPGYAKAYFYLGQAYLRADREEEARQAIAAYQRLSAEGGTVEPP